MSFKKILVAIDRSSLASEVFEQALELAQKDKASLLVFHCLSREDWQEFGPLLPGGLGLYSPMTENLYRLQQEHLQEKIQQVQEWLRTYCQKATDQGIPTEFDYKVESAGPRICDVAQKWGADLIVLGRRGRNGLTEFLLGSVSNYVVHHAACSVLIAQRGISPVLDPDATATLSSSKASL